MRLNHVNLVVKDVEQAIRLFTEYMGLNLIVNRHSKMAVLDSANDFALVIWGQALNNEEGIPEYPKNFHVGFYQQDEDAVRDIYQKLKDVEGLTFESEPKTIRSTFGFYFYLESLMIEISVNPFSQNLA
jgi:catechol 2,3-dioxygenase-like lactoylglutathione lyase family enzyme